MSDSIEGLRKKIHSAGDLGSVVKTMKAIAASSLNQYEKSVQALDEYYKTVELGILACLRNNRSGQTNSRPVPQLSFPKDLVVFGSDQGLVGKFNEVIADFVLDWLKNFKGNYRLWIVGKRVESIFLDGGLDISGKFNVPSSVNGITSLIGTILSKIQPKSLAIFYNRPEISTTIDPVFQHVLPIGKSFHSSLTFGSGYFLAKNSRSLTFWPTKQLPTVLGDVNETWHACVREYIFVSLFRGCAQSLASENSSRLASMQRAEKNIDEMVADLELVYNRIRQGNIDEELFDVIAGFEAVHMDSSYRHAPAAPGD
jgi:F-type H+-transporting ATPase subunit gamma